MSHFYEKFFCVISTIFKRTLTQFIFFTFFNFYCTKNARKSQIVVNYVLIWLSNAFSQSQNNNKYILFKISEQKFGKSKLSELRKENEWKTGCDLSVFRRFTKIDVRNTSVRYTFLLSGESWNFENHVNILFFSEKFNKESQMNCYPN